MYNNAVVSRKLFTFGFRTNRATRTAFRRWSRLFRSFFVHDETRFPFSPPTLFRILALFGTGLLAGLQNLQTILWRSTVTTTFLSCWSKLSVEESDVPPTYLSKPVLRSLSYSHGTLSNLFTTDSALNPQVAFDKNNTAHIVWEKITPLDSLLPLMLGMFTKYSSEVFYRTRLSNGTLSVPVPIGRGFSPQVLIAPDNSVYVLWFGADSNTANRYQLLYRKWDGNVFSGSSNYIRIDTIFFPVCLV